MIVMICTGKEITINLSIWVVCESDLIGDIIYRPYA